MTSREVVIKTIKFEGPDRFAYDFPDPYGTDFAEVGMAAIADYTAPSADAKEWTDEWGVTWRRLGKDVRGEPKGHPIEDWKDFENYKFPDMEDPRRWVRLDGARERAGDKFLLGHGIEIYERIHYLRGMENTWVDIYENPDELCQLLDKLTEMNLTIIDKYAKAGVDGFIFCDDWGLQDRLMISPAKWREIWKPRYARIYEAAHKAGILTFLHSCGYIVDILDDLIEIGLDVIHMDQQENMTLELLGSRFGGRLTFWSPVDIQNTMVNGTLDDIRVYCHKMVKYLWRPEGGFIPRWYTDPEGAGHRREAIDAMCQEFLKISKEIYGK